MICACVNRWEDYKEQQFIYEKNLYKYNQPDSRFDNNRNAERPWQERKDEYVPPLSLAKLTFQERQNALRDFELNQNKQKYEFQIELEQQKKRLQHARVYCPFSSFDDITMYATIGEAKDPDALVIDSSLISNSQNGINATSLQSLVQVNSTQISGNELNGLSIHGGAGDVSISHCSIEENRRSGVNVTYAGGLKEFNYTRVNGNRLYGIYVDYNVDQEMDNIFQNTTINSSVIENNYYGGK